MLISRKFTVDDWKALTFGSEADWQKAVTKQFIAISTSQKTRAKAIMAP